MLKKENHGDNDNVNVNVDVITSLKYCEMESAKFNFLVWRRGGGGGGGLREGGLKASSPCLITGIIHTHLHFN